MLIYSAVKLTVKRKTDGTPPLNLAIATGFFWSVNNTLYLITNWHNVTAWDPIQNKCMSDTGAQPTHVEMPLLLKAGDSGGRPMVERRRFDIPLYTDHGKPTWMEHPVFGNKIDVVALELLTLKDNLVSLPINKIGDLVDFEPLIGDDVFVLGYPGGLDGGNELAIWKRGSLASQPQVDVDGLPKLLIDTATRKGMSGAPVIARRSGIIVPRGVTPELGKISGQEIIGQAKTFLGVYSGRVGDDPLGVQLGIVWKARVLDEIVNGRTQGTSPF